MEKNYFADNLRVLRKAHKLTQTQIADKLGLSVSLVSFWESGKREPVLDDVRKIANMFNVSIADLVGRDITQTYADVVEAEKERELILYYRSLTSDQQSAVLTMVKGMAKV